MINKSAILFDDLPYLSIYKKYLSVLRTMEKLGSELIVMPDFSEKSIGLPSGLVVTNPNYIFPASVPDIGDGYRIVLTNLSVDQFNDKVKLKLLNRLLEEGTVKSTSRLKFTKEKIDLNKVFLKGNEYIANLTTDSELMNYKKWQSEKNQKVHNVILPKEDLLEYQYYFGIFGSPFLEFRYIKNLRKNDEIKKLGLFENQVIFIIHVGALIGKRILRQRFIKPAIEYSVKNLDLSEKELMEELFVFPVNSAVGREFLEYAKMLVNYSEANRGIAYFRIKHILEEIWGENNIRCKILSDILHSKYQENNRGISSFRGVQQLYPANSSHTMREKIDDFALVGGSTRTTSLLVTSGNSAKKVRYCCSHGIGNFYSVRNLRFDKNFKTKKIFCNKSQTNEEIFQDEYNCKKSFRNLFKNQIIDIMGELEPLINLWDESNL